MNKTLRIAIFVAIAFIVFSCTKGNDQNLPEEQYIKITASHADNQTKTTLQDGGTDVYWEPGDEIKLFYDGTGSRFTSTSTSISTTSNFSGSLNFVFGYNEGVGGNKHLWGVYPYRADAISDGQSITTTLPSKQIGRTGSFAKNTNITLAKSNSFNMGFFNVCGGVRFSLTQSDVKEVIFESQGEESLAGKIKLSFQDGVPVVQEITDGVSSITLTAPNNGTFETGKWYYIVALPGTLASGLIMTFNTETQYATLKSSKPVTFKRGVFGSLTDVDKNLEYKDKPSPEPPTGENIQFKDVAVKAACVEKFDTNKDGEVSYEEAAAVTSIANLFKDWNGVKNLDDLQYFTGISNMSQAMKGLTKLESVIIPKNVTSLENYAFDGCTALESLTFSGNNVVSIGNYALRGCIALSELELPSGVTSIGQYTFSGCTALTELELPSSVNSIGQYAFSGCSSLTAIDIPSTITTISNYSFQNCTSLKTIGFPSGLSSIGSSAFLGCEKLESVDFPSSLNSISQYAFQNCKSIKTLIIPNSVSSLGSYVFSGCTSLESVVLPSGLTSIPSGAFSECESLYKITFPTALTTIGDNAFNSCSFIDNTTHVAVIELPSTVTTIRSKAFSGAYNVLVTSSSLVSIQSNTFSNFTNIFVSDAEVEVYKVRTNWSNFSNQIFPISSYTDKPLLGEEVVDLGLSVKWRNRNVGANSALDNGIYFAWGDVVGQTWNGSAWSGGGFSADPSYQVDDNNNLKPEYDAAHVNLGGTWRMPTEAEYNELIDNCTSIWTCIKGVFGTIFRSNKEGYTDKYIFLPAAGCGYNTSYGGIGSYGYYCSSSFDSGSDYAWYLYLSSGDVCTISFSRSYGRSIRPVSE